MLFLAGAAGQEKTDKARAGHGLEQVRSSARQGKLRGQDRTATEGAASVQWDIRNSVRVCARFLGGVRARVLRKWKAQKCTRAKEARLDCEICMNENDSDERQEGVVVHDM